MPIGLRSPSESYIGYSPSKEAKALLKSVIEGFKYHPLFFMLRESGASEDPVYPFAHQLELLVKLFARKPIRVLVGDEIGLGKTVSAIMIIKYLIKVKGARRVLILVPRILMQQWLAELRRFGFSSSDVVQLERDTIAVHYNLGFPQRVYIASIDLVKREGHKEKILATDWDLVVVDEAHRVGRVGNRETQRYELVEELVSKPNVNVVLLTATPHRGKPEDYIERLKLVDPYLSAGAKELDNEKFYGLSLGSIVFRRTKLDVNEVYEKSRIFTDCRFKARVVKASEEEEEFSGELREFLRRKLLSYYDMIGEEPKALPLLMALIAKRASSSPRAALKTLDRILAKRADYVKLLAGWSLEAERGKLDAEAEVLADAFLGYSFEDIGLYEDEVRRGVDADEILDDFAEKCSILLNPQDVEELRRLHRLASSIKGEKDSRLSALVNVVRNHVRSGDRVVIFTEFRDTAKYVFEELKSRLPEVSDKMALVTSEEVVPPPAYSGYSRRYSIEDVKRWLRSGEVEVLISTDVASEGLNLQVANVVVHYEPTWSPVKIVQRIGRVWRLGQEKNVHSYSLLLTVESDMAVLEVLYAKLLSWLVSGVERTLPIGEELEIDMLPGDRPAADLLQIPLVGEKGRPQYSEYKALISFIIGGRNGLKNYIESIISMFRALKRQAERLSSRRVDRIKVEKFLEAGLGNLYGKEAERVLESLLATSARLSGFEVEERGSRLFIKGTNIIVPKTPHHMYGATESLLKEVNLIAPVLLVARKPQDAFNVKELHLYEVTVNVGGSPAYSEVVGVAVKDDASTDTYRGLRLLKSLNELLLNVTGTVDQLHQEGRFDETARLKVLDGYRNMIVSDFVRYLAEVEKGFSYPHEGWLPREGGGRDASHFISASSKLLGVILVSDGHVATRPPPPIAVEEVERKAMEFAMEFERRNGRVPEDVSKVEHYDIKSVDPRTKDVRYIEVKGRWGLDITVELTEPEYEYARELGDKYWLYIVYGFSTGSPRLLAIRDPVNRAKWGVVEMRRYRLLGV